MLFSILHNWNVSALVLFCRGFRKAQVHIGQVPMGKGRTLLVAGLIVALTIRLDIPLQPQATVLSQLSVTRPPHPLPQLLYQLLPRTHLPQAFPWPKRASMRRAAMPLWPTTAALSTHLARQLPTPQAIHSSVLQCWARRAWQQAPGLTMCTWVPTRLPLHLPQHCLPLHLHPTPTSPQVALPSLTQPQ